MNVKYQIFVSATHDDLAEERRAVMEAILNLGHMPVGMEWFHATDESQWDHIKRRIAECDYYVVIVAERYGSEFDGKSYTQKEYELAVQLGIPVIALLLHADARSQWPSHKVEFDKKEKVEAFRSLCKQRLVKFWKSTDDLALKVTQSLGGIFADIPRIGWVRADTIPSMKAFDEFALLSEEKRALQERVDSLEAENKGISADDKLRLKELAKARARDFLTLFGESDMSMLQLFMALHRKLAIGATETAIRGKLPKILPFSFETVIDIDSIMAEFCRFHLTEFETLEKRERQYFLTDYGKDIALLAPRWLAEQATDD